MMHAGQEERKLAIECKDFDDSVPAITVICDGGWCKRTHKHTYNAMEGVAIAHQCSKRTVTSVHKPKAKVSIPLHTSALRIGTKAVKRWTTTDFSCMQCSTCVVASWPATLSLVTSNRLAQQDQRGCTSR